jgi:flagellar motility protein MotE (MotC chaperone)
MMTTLRPRILSTGFFIAGLLAASSAFAEASALPAKSQAQSSAIQSVQPKVDAKAAEAASEKRRFLTVEALTAIEETKQALKFLEEKKSGDALKALATVTGKLELIVAREPKLALAPVDVTVSTQDLLSSLDTTKAAIKASRD